MSETRRAAAIAAVDPAALREIEEYVAKRLAAEAELVTASMNRRRFGAPPIDCDGEYDELGKGCR